MRRTYVAFLNSILFCGFLLGCNTTSSKPTSGQSEEHSIVHDGIKRTYSIYIPKWIKKSQSVQLLMALHGGGGSAKKWPEYTNNGFERLAEREQFILVYPNGLEGQWNDGRGVQRFLAQRERIDDSGFLAKLIDNSIKTYPIDPERVFVAEASNGGMMAHRLAAEHSDKVAAIARVISSIPRNLQGRLKPKHPVSVLMINGTEDPLVRWEGGPVKFGKNTNGEVLSTDQTVKF